MVDSQFVYDLFRAGLFSGSFRVLRFVSLSSRLKTSQITENICMTWFKRWFGTPLGKRKNAIKRREYQYFVCCQFTKNTGGNNISDCSPAWNSVDFGHTSAPAKIMSRRTLDISSMVSCGFSRENLTYHLVVHLKTCGDSEMPMISHDIAIVFSWYSHINHLTHWYSHLDPSQKIPNLDIPMTKLI